MVNTHLSSTARNVLNEEIIYMQIRDNHTERDGVLCMKISFSG